MVGRAVAVGLVAALSLGAAQGAELTNATTRILFADADAGFGITGVVNRLTVPETRFVRGRSDWNGGNFWQLEFRRAVSGGTNISVWVSNLDRASNHTFVRRPDGSLVFRWLGVDLPNEPGVADVAAEVRLVEDGTAKWRLSVRNRSTQWALAQTRYPVFAGVAEPGAADVLLPSENLGAKLVRGFVPVHYSLYEKFSPSLAPMVTAWHLGEAGFYLAATDPEMRNKRLAYYANSVFFETPVENAGVVGKAGSGPGYAVTTACYRGDWWQAARLYRAWALQQKWTAKGPLARRTDSPKVLPETDVWIRALWGDPTEFRTARELWPDVRIGVRHYCWHNERFDTHYPELTPRSDVAALTKEVCDAGALSVPYVNGRLWDLANDSFAAAKPDACQRADGTPFEEQYAARFAVMCPATTNWQAILRRASLDALEKLGANGLYLDQITCSRWCGCRNPAHGHPLEGGKWWADGYRQALAPLKRELSARGIPIISESAGEMWMDLIDGALVNGRSPLPGDVPFFPAVYSGYVTYLCTDQDPTDSPEAVFAVQARGVLQGVATGSWDDRAMLERDPKKRTLVRQAEVIHRLARLHKVARDYLAYGFLQDEVRPLAPVGTVELTIQRTRDKLKRKDTLSFPSAFGYVWRTVDETRRAVVAANPSATERRLTFKAPAGRPCLRELKDERPSTLSCAGDTVTLTLPPLGLAFVEFLP